MKNLNERKATTPCWDLAKKEKSWEIYILILRTYLHEIVLNLIKIVYQKQSKL